MELNFPSVAALVVETAGANWPTSWKNALKVNFWDRCPSNCLSPRVKQNFTFFIRRPHFRGFTRQSPVARRLPRPMSLRIRWL